MMKKTVLFSVATVVCFSSAFVEAQIIYRPVKPRSQVILPAPQPYPYHPPYIVRPYDPGNLRGRAAMIRAQAEARRAKSQTERNRSEIRRNNAETRSRELDNQKKRIEQRAELKRQYQAKREAYYAKKRVARDLYLQRQRAKAQDRKVRESVAIEGENVHWPQELLKSQYDANRQKLDELIRSHAQGEHEQDFSKSVKAATTAMRTLLKKNIRTMSANDYLATRRFLESLSQAAIL